MFRVTVNGETFTSGDLARALTIAQLESDGDALPWTIEWSPDE